MDKYLARGFLRYLGVAHPACIDLWGYKHIFGTGSGIEPGAWPVVCVDDHMASAQVAGKCPAYLSAGLLDRGAGDVDTPGQRPPGLLSHGELVLWIDVGDASL